MFLSCWAETRTWVPEFQHTNTRVLSGTAGPQTVLVSLLQPCRLSTADMARAVGARPSAGLHCVLPSERLREILSLLQFPHALKPISVIPANPHIFLL